MAIREAGASPNNNSGFGLVNLANSVIIPGPDVDGGFGVGGPLNQSESDTFEVNIPEAPPNSGERHPDAAHTMSLTPTYKITLVWTDRQGKVLQNDLDLIVIASDGTERHGNSGTSSNFDRLNNVEQVKWTNIPPGPVKIVVNAHKISIARFPQPYAYAWRITWS